MRILAIDTATEGCSVALWQDGESMSRETQTDREHARLILPMVHELLADAGLRLWDLTAIAFGRGPGAFTGVRLAASVTQGLAFGAQIPVVGISDLRAVAQKVRRLDPQATRVIVCNDARMQEVYWGCFECGAGPSAGLMQPLCAERVSSPTEVCLPLDWGSTRGTPVIGAGRGFAAYAHGLIPLVESLARVDDRLLPSACDIASLAANEAREGRTLPAEQALPTYLRNDVTQRKS